MGTAGRITYFDLEGEYVTDSHITCIRLENSLYNPKYIHIALTNLYSREYLESLCNGSTGQIELAKDTILNLEIPILSLEIQEKIVEEFEEERFYIKQTENFIERQKNKIYQILNSLWDQNKD